MKGGIRRLKDRVVAVNVTTPDKALLVLEDSVERHPGDRDSLLALVNFSRADGEPAKALHYAEQLAKIEPDNQQLAVLIQKLRREIAQQTDE